MFLYILSRLYSELVNILFHLYILLQFMYYILAKIKTKIKCGKIGEMYMAQCNEPNVLRDLYSTALRVVLVITHSIHTNPRY